MILTPFIVPGVQPDNTTAVHWGFLRAFNSVADAIISIMEEQYTLHPHYRLVCTGIFSLGAVFNQSRLTGHLRSLFGRRSRVSSSRHFTFKDTRASGKNQVVYFW